jgi:hypothetical protein
MKKVGLLILAVTMGNCTLAQNVESFASITSGLFSFQGVSAEKTSQINVSRGNTGYTNNPFGARNGLSYGLSFQIQSVSKGNFIAGVNIGYENLRSRTTIDAINGFDGTATFQDVASGRSNLSNQFINGFPYVGYRVVNKQVAVDLTGGLDLGYLFAAQETGKATGAGGVTYRALRDRSSIKFDVRPRVQVSVIYKKAGVYIGYAYGLQNYRSGWVGGPNQCHAELIRFGLLYKLRG